MSKFDLEADVDFLSKLLPTLSGSLTEVALKRPSDVHAFLALELLRRSNFKGSFVALAKYVEGIEYSPEDEMEEEPEPQTSSSSLTSAELISERPTSEEPESARPVQQRRPLRVCIAGAPCSGKGTQCDLIRERYNLVHLSTGDMLRDEVKAGSELGKQAESCMSQGLLVPDELIIGIVKARLEQSDCAERGWLLDGFPRTQQQAQAMKSAGIVPDVFLALQVPDEVVIERVTGRRLDPETGKIYHLKFDPPAAEIENRLIQRADDTEEKIRVRLGQFHQNIAAIESEFSSPTKVDGNQSKAAVFSQICLAIDQVDDI